MLGHYIIRILLEAQERIACKSTQSLYFVFENE
jgi:hypothetical protein